MSVAFTLLPVLCRADGFSGDRVGRDLYEVCNAGEHVSSLVREWMFRQENELETARCVVLDWRLFRNPQVGP